MPLLVSAIKEEISLFKKQLSEEDFFKPFSGQGLPIEENGRVIGSLFAHSSLNRINEKVETDGSLALELKQKGMRHYFPLDIAHASTDFSHHEIDERFSNDFSSIFSDPNQVMNLSALAYKTRGEVARDYGYYDQSLCDLTRAIEIEPTNPDPYFERSATYFEMGQYDQSIEDFNHFTTRCEEDPSKHLALEEEFTLGFTKTLSKEICESGKGFAKAVPIGVYESGKGLVSFAANLITNPVHTATETYKGMALWCLVF